jgi:hypothetical protein
MHKLEQHQQITPLTAVSAADQGVAYLKYQQALIFPFEGRIFNALTVLSVAHVHFPPRMEVFFVPGVNSRPERVSDIQSLYDTACSVYEKACLVYEAELEEVRVRVTKVFDSPFVDTDLGDENDAIDDTSDKD